MTDLIANLRDNFGAPPDTSTIKGIQRYGEMWLSEEETVNSLEFKRACESMMGVLGRAITATEADLEQTGATHQSLSDPVERSIEAYERLREVLGDLVDTVGAEDRARAKGLLDELSEAAESAFRRDARSPVGAQGLGQLMPGTAAMLGVTDPWDPSQNLSGTVRYLSRQLRRWDQDASLALASYNAGPGAVQRYGGIPPYRETREYVSYVLGLHQELKSLERRRTTVSQKRTKSNS